MGTVTIRNLDDWVIDALKAQAKANQRSLEAELRFLLTQHVNRRRRIGQFRERTARIADATSNVPQTDSAELIRQDRERPDSVPEEHQTVPLFHTHIVVDWSARSKPSPARETKDSIWWATARITRRGVRVRKPEYARTRHEALDRLAGLIGGELKAGRRVLVGFDFPFGYPAGVAEHLTGKASALALWDWLAAEIKDAPDNGNNRYEVAAAFNDAYPGLGPFWGRPPHGTTLRSRCGPRCARARLATRPSVASATNVPRAQRPSGSWPMPAPSARKCCWACLRSSG